jgi:hypothetical protein
VRKVSIAVLAVSHLRRAELALPTTGGRSMQSPELGRGTRAGFMDNFDVHGMLTCYERSWPGDPPRRFAPGVVRGVLG